MNLSLTVEGIPYWESTSADARQIFGDSSVPQRWGWDTDGTFFNNLTATIDSTATPLILSGSAVELDLVDLSRAIYGSELASNSLITLGADKFSYGEIFIFWSGENDAGDYADFNIAGSISTISTGTTVPVPAAAWLLGSALGLMGVAARRRRHA
ncbi:MAG: VPLPA-CTERM sorting domain-containing protein [Gammaproteobacteria bacterium]